MVLSVAVVRAESNGGSFIFVHSLQRPTKCIKKFRAVIFVGYLDHLGIQNNRINFMFLKCIIESN